MPRCCAELGAGLKTSHWMWFVFPQLKSLGRSSTARFYGLEDRAEAAAYWRHPLLGPRLAGMHPARAGDDGPVGARHLRLARRPEASARA